VSIAYYLILTLVRWEVVSLTTVTANVHIKQQNHQECQLRITSCFTSWSSHNLFLQKKRYTLECWVKYTKKCAQQLQVCIH